MWQQQNKGYVETCTNQPVDSLLQTVVIGQVDECIGPVVKTYVHVLLNILTRQAYDMHCTVKMKETFFIKCQKVKIRNLCM